MAMQDWTQFSRKIRIKSSVKNVYDAWAIPSELSSWFLKSIEIKGETNNGNRPLGAGDQTEWIWNNLEKAFDIDIIRANGKNEITFTFGHGMEVTVKISEENEFAVVTLRQYNIPTDDESKMNYYVGCGQAWSTWMLNLKSYIEHGIVLHDTTLGERKDLFTFVNT